MSLPSTAQSLQQDRENQREYTLHVSGLTPQSTEDSLREAFTPFGRIVRVALITNRSTRESRGYGFVSFETADEAEQALRKMNRAQVDGAEVTVEYAQKKREDRERERDGGRRDGGRSRGGRDDRRGDRRDYRDRSPRRRDDQYGSSRDDYSQYQQMFDPSHPMFHQMMAFYQQQQYMMQNPQAAAAAGYPMYPMMPYGYPSGASPSPPGAPSGKPSFNTRHSNGRGSRADRRSRSRSPRSHHKRRGSPSQSPVHSPSRSRSRS